MQAARATIESLFVILELRHDVVAAIGLQQPPNRAVREPPPNLHQLVANTPLAVLGARPTAFFQCSLRFADGAKSQLLISHCCLPKMARGASRWKNQVGIEVIQSIFVSIPGSKCGTNVSLASECGHDCLPAVIRSSSSRFRSGGRSRHRVLGTAEHRGQLPGGAGEGSWPAGQPQGNNHQKSCLRRSLRQRRLRVREALDDHFSNGDKLRPPAAFEKHRDEIEALARRKYLCGPLEPDRSFSFALPKSHEILQPPNLHYDRK